ncbi:P-II family nitrogen regulator [Methanococcoides burtonii]|uniref:Nitrogen regulatory protein P-II n=1 Tax=Methanococcoides burtonii (strain DSM 6242 / NBRC 107633 / OCM 468 / ACE-M) TaxID=259564 RepID=Q12XF0_METBU|nr:P-II family nitrogen regulator [Methanococcoides burtonii]ABE51876.1 Nitrogen regulatory protein P-II [Methanococcoides burtonii DSM 6242]
MKKITAIIRPGKLETVKEELVTAGLNAMTIFDVKGRGEQKGICLQFRGKRNLIDMIPKIQIDIVVKNDEVVTVIQTIKHAVRTGKIGDGKIFGPPVEMMIGIRTGECITE